MLAQIKGADASTLIRLLRHPSFRNVLQTTHWYRKKYSILSIFAQFLFSFPLLTTSDIRQLLYSQSERDVLPHSMLSLRI